MKKITLEKILKKIAMFEALEIVLDDTIVADDISGLLRKYKVLRKNAEDAELELTETLVYPESDEEIANMTAAMTNPVRKTINYKGCEITKGHRFGTYLIISGKISTTFTQSTPNTITNFFNKIKAEGLIDNSGLVISEIECSASMAVSLISGSNQNGRPILASLWD